jgi:hypothetical protein
MFVKITNGQVAQYPYTVGDLRRDNPNVSFPKTVPTGVMARYGMYPVSYQTDPDYNLMTHRIENSAKPEREIIGYTTNEDARDPATGEIDFDKVGLPKYSGRWIITKTVVSLTEEEIAALDAQAAKDNRTKRNDLLAATDYLALTDNTMDDTTKGYRQALRDITNHPNWPHLLEGDWPIKSSV